MDTILYAQTLFESWCPFHLGREPREGSKAVFREAGLFHLSSVQVSLALRGCGQVGCLFPSSLSLFQSLGPSGLDVFYLGGYVLVMEQQTRS